MAGVHSIWTFEIVIPCRTSTAFGHSKPLFPAARVLHASCTRVSTARCGGAFASKQGRCPTCA
eukprot:363429-Chlamydomonas_euryale.AAC.2